MCVHPIVTTLKDISLYFLTKSICCWSGFYAERLYGAKPIDNLINSEKDKNGKRKVERDCGIEGQAFYNFIESLCIFIRCLTILLVLPGIATYNNQLKYFFRGFFRNKTINLHF